jgi:hypothetical protein
LRAKRAFAERKNPGCRSPDDASPNPKCVPRTQGSKIGFFPPMESPVCLPWGVPCWLSGLACWCYSVVRILPSFSHETCHIQPILQSYLVSGTRVPTCRVYRSSNQPDVAEFIKSFLEDPKFLSPAFQGSIRGAFGHASFWRFMRPTFLFAHISNVFAPKGLNFAPFFWALNASSRTQCVIWLVSASWGCNASLKHFPPFE